MTKLICLVLLFALSSCGEGPEASAGPKCDPRECQTGEFCVGTRCVAEPCSPPCADTEFCDPSVPKCYPLDGSECNKGCGALFDVPSTFGTKACDADNICRLSPIPRPLDVPGWEQIRDLPLTTPEDGQVYERSDQLQIAWQPPASAVTSFFLLLDQLPSSVVDLGTSAIWGAVVAAGDAQSSCQCPAVGWTSGSGIESGSWGRPLPQLLSGKTYYLLAEGLRNGTLVLKSNIARIRVGEGWPADETPCSSDAECLLPGTPRVCLPSGCHSVCASNLDCRVIDPESSCLAPAGGIRVCGYQSE